MKDQGIVLSGMPNLEWAPNNLTGHGGTEIDGCWYYTWEQALAAAAELGDGWRLPTAEEFEQLCDAGSTWVNEGPDGIPGRWFGGNHATDHEGSVFFPASGYRNRTSGALTNVGSNGYYWSSSPNSSGSTNAGSLSFGATLVNPLHGTDRAYGFTVRCVRTSIDTRKLDRLSYARNANRDESISCVSDKFLTTDGDYHIRRLQWNRQIRYVVTHPHGIVQVSLYPDKIDEDDSAVVHDLYVDANYRKKGIATALLDIAERIAVKNNYKKCQLTFYPDTTPKEVMDWYKRRGYKVIGYLRNEWYYLEKKL